MMREVEDNPKPRVTDPQKEERDMTRRRISRWSLMALAVGILAVSGLLTSPAQAVQLPGLSETLVVDQAIAVPQGSTVIESQCVNATIFKDPDSDQVHLQQAAAIGAVDTPSVVCEADGQYSSGVSTNTASALALVNGFKIFTGETSGLIGPRAELNTAAGHDVPDSTTTFQAPLRL